MSYLNVHQTGFRSAINEDVIDYFGGLLLYCKEEGALRQCRGFLEPTVSNDPVSFYAELKEFSSIGS